MIGKASGEKTLKEKLPNINTNFTAVEITRINTSLIFNLKHRVVFRFAAYLLGMEICLGGQVRAGSRGHGGTAAAPGQRRMHRCQPLHGSEARDEGFHPDVPQKTRPEKDSRVEQSLEENTPAADFKVLVHRQVSVLDRRGAVRRGAGVCCRLTQPVLSQ